VNISSIEQLGIEHLSVFGLPPVSFVNLAADLGCRYIATGLTAFPYNPHGYGPFSLRDDAPLRREMTGAMRDRGVSISLGEGCTVLPGTDISRCAADLDIMRGLGITRISTVSLDSDLNRTFDQFAALAEMAGARDMEVVVEPCPVTGRSRSSRGWCRVKANCHCVTSSPYCRWIVCSDSRCRCGQQRKLE